MNHLQSLRYIVTFLTVKLNGGRSIQGILRGFDPFMNLVIDEGIGKRKDGAEENIGMVVGFWDVTANLFQDKKTEFPLSLCVKLAVHPSFLDKVSSLSKFIMEAYYFLKSCAFLCFKFFTCTRYWKNVVQHINLVQFLVLHKFQLSWKLVLISWEFKFKAFASPSFTFDQV